MSNILKHVDIADLININVVVPNITRPDVIQVDITALEEGKHVVIDTDALDTFNCILVEKCQQFDNARDPKVKEYIKEFTHRMCQEWDSAGLIVIEDIPEAVDDPYAHLRRLN